MKLKELRQKAHKTQKEMAEMLNMSQTGYNGYEIGRSEPDIETLKKLSKIFMVSIDELVENGKFNPYDKNNLSMEHQDTINKIEKLSKEHCQRVDDFITGLLISEETKNKKDNKWTQ